MSKKTYLTSYCNKHHDLVTGKPIDHECRTLPPAALHAERADAFDTADAILGRCGACSNCKKLAKVQKSVLACCNPPFSHADQDVVDVWNAELARLPCEGERWKSNSTTSPVV